MRSSIVVGVDGSPAARAARVAASFARRLDYRLVLAHAASDPPIFPLRRADRARNPAASRTGACDLPLATSLEAISNCPVVVVSGSAAKGLAMALPPPVGAVVVGVDGSPGSMHARVVAAGLGGQLGLPSSSSALAVDNEVCRVLPSAFIGLRPFRSWWCHPMRHVAPFVAKHLEPRAQAA